MLLSDTCKRFLFANLSEIILVQEREICIDNMTEERIKRRTKSDTIKKEFTWLVERDLAFGGNPFSPESLRSGKYYLFPDDKTWWFEIIFRRFGYEEFFEIIPEWNYDSKTHRSTPGQHKKICYRTVDVRLYLETSNGCLLPFGRAKPNAFVPKKSITFPNKTRVIESFQDTNPKYLKISGGCVLSQIIHEEFSNPEDHESADKCNENGGGNEEKCNTGQDDVVEVDEDEEEDDQEEGEEDNEQDEEIEVDEHL